MSFFPAFYAYPAEPRGVADTIERAVAALRDRFKFSNVTTWRETDIAGRFIADQILARVASVDVLFADITRLNFNVAYEIGFALARAKRVVLTRHRGITPTAPTLQDVGIFDTLGYKEYENTEELIDILSNVEEASPSLRNTSGLNKNVPVYLLQARFRTDHVTRIVSRIKKARLFFRSFDPTETPRLSVTDAMDNVGQSYGVLLHLLPASIADADIHNLRAAFLAGLAEGFDKILLLLQDGEEPVPLDYRELVKVFRHPSQIDEAIAEFATAVTEALQQEVTQSYEQEQTPLDRVTFGASAAENELRDLAGYYLETDQFRRALRGELRLVVGRKGSGKTAIFAQVRDQIRRDRANVVLDLRPDGYQLLKFKEMVLAYLGMGAQEHTITAFWEYLLLLEVCHKLLEKDRIAHMRDQRLYEPYRRLADLYQSDDYVSEGDFFGTACAATPAHRRRLPSKIR
ncbi:MAG TPA: hypothetical protein VGQ65_14570 [Thermoanaerobaculia bacterium]|jgi:hypothetical protein|nr:hypothetical protein [Thermoanaerobaculia bacterium]